MDFSEKLISEFQIKADQSLARVCRWVALLMCLIAMLNFLGVFVISGKYMYGVIGASVLIALLPTFVFNVLKCNKELMKYLVLTSIALMCSIMYTILSYHTVVMLVFPLVCACLYSERKWIIYTMVISIPMIIVSHLLALHLKIVPDEPLITLHGVIFYGIIPRLIQFLAIGIICISITKKIQALIQALINKNKQLYDDQQMMIESLAELVESQSQETGFHVKRVSEYTRILCEGLDYDEEKTWKVSIASMMHDVGKLLIPKEIIEKPGKLTEEEFDIVKRHVDYGKQILEKSPGEVMQLSAIIAYEHHEKWDGTGYKRMSGESIHPYARCVAIADVFDALVSWRPYKEPWSAQQAYDEIVSYSGTYFDPQLVEIFKKHFGKFEAVMEKFPDAKEEILMNNS